MLIQKAIPREKGNCAVLADQVRAGAEHGGVDLRAFIFMA